eukprot:13930104-Heterocapsa_arctica.AAC.1
MGVATDVTGNCMWEFLDCEELFPGNKQSVRLKALWDDLHAWQITHKVEHKISGLSLKMIKSGKEAPKIGCKAAESRGLQPW